MIKYRSSLILSHLTLIIPVLCPLIMCYQCQVFVIRSVFPLPYNIGSPYLIHTFIMNGTSQPGICHLTLISFSWFTDFVKFMFSFHYYVSFSILPYNLGSSYLVHTLMMEDTYLCICHLSLISVYVHGVVKSYRWCNG